MNAYLAAACLMHDSLDESSNQAVAQVARGMDVTLDTGCPGAWSGQSAEQLKSLEQTHCEYLSLTTGHPVSWPTCCNGGPDDSCTYPPPRSTTAELCAACPVGTQSYVDGGGRWFDKAKFECYQVSNETDSCQIALDDMRVHCSKAIDNADTGHAPHVGEMATATETRMCFASIARVRAAFV